MAISSEIGAAILAGGRSARMGTNKALLRRKADGPTIIEEVVAALRAADFESPLLVTDSPADYDFLRLPTIPDDVPDGGPLGGILTVLNHSPYDRMLVVACDMPLLNPALLRYLASIREESDAIVPRWGNERGRERVEMLHAIYARSCIDPIRSALGRGERKVSTLLDHIRVRYIAESEIRLYDPGLDSFRNVNTPEDWQQLAG